MTAGTPSTANVPRPRVPMHAGHALRPRPPAKADPATRTWFEHSSAQRVNTNTVIVEALRAEYPELHLIIAPTYPVDLL